jgi:VCBS repeat protein
MRSTFLIFTFCCGATTWAAARPAFFARHDYPTNGHVAVADVNGDGIPDVVSWFSHTVFTLLGNGDGTFRVGPSSEIGFEFIPLAALFDEIRHI